MAILQPDNTYKVNGLTVKEFLLTNHNSNGIDMPNRKRKKTVGITIHNTESISVSSSTTPAEQYVRATKNGNMKDVRVHFYVDDYCAWQCLPFDEINWSCADGTSNPNSGNNTTIAIEVIGNSSKAEQNAVKLAAYLLNKYNLTADKNLFTHSHWMNVRDGKTGSIDYLNTAHNSRKNCPIYILPHWDTFKNNVKTSLASLKGEKPNLVPIQLYRIRKSWDDSKSQIGAYSSIDNAKKACKNGYSVFDEKGNMVYSMGSAVSVENNEYDYNSTIQLSKHFNITEFRCKCGKAHKTKLESQLVNKLEELYDKLNCSKIIITSGYRCQEHDKNVGGSGFGQHTKGTAADIICYDINGDIISSKIISCVAQDLGFMGIGNINDKYQAIHVDVRKSNKWYGDEVINNNTITSNFYDYYGISKMDIQKYTGVLNNSTDNNKIDIYYRVYTNTWLPETINANNYTGVDGTAIRGLVIKADKGDLKYRVHVNGGGWLSWISKYDTSNWNDGCAGLRSRDIDAIQIDYNEPGYEVRYRVSTTGSNNYSNWIIGFNTTNSMGYAGSFGKSIDKVQIEIVKK